MIKLSLNKSITNRDEEYEHWHDVLARVMYKCGVKNITLTQEDIQAFPTDLAVALNHYGDHIEVRILTVDEARKLAREYNEEQDK